MLISNEIISSVFIEYLLHVRQEVRRQVCSDEHTWHLSSDSCVMTKIDLSQKLFDVFSERGISRYPITMAGRY